MAAFSSSSFSTDAFSVLAFDFGSAPPVDIETKGGILGHREYRKHIERLELITRTKEITPAIIAAAEAVDDIPVDTPEITKIASNIQVIDYSALAAELAAIQAYMDGLSIYGGMINDYMQEQEDELLILLMVN